MQLEWWRAERITLMGFVAVLGGVLALSVLGYGGIDALEQNVQSISERYNQENILIQSMNRIINQRMVMVRDILLADDPFQQDEMAQKYSRLALDYNHYYSQLLSLDRAPDEQSLLERLSKQVAGASDLRETIRNLPSTTSDLDIKGLLNRTMVLNSEIHSILDQLQVQQRQDFEANLKRVRHIHSRNLVILSATFLLIFIVMLYIAYRVSGYVKRSNRQLTTMAMEKSMLLATMSHEIRTPLTSIIGFGETLLETDTTKEERISGIHAIVRNGRYLQGVINDVLDFSKLDAGQMELHTEPVSLPGCLDDLDNMLRGRAQSKGLNFNIIAHGELPEHIETDYIKLRQIVINLLSNAIKFTEFGEVSLEVSFDEGRGEMQFDVIDTGMGIEQEQIQRLFTPYRQVGESHQEGTGLGLYISREMAELLGGDLAVRSELGKGSRFTLHVPVGDTSKQPRLHWRHKISETPAGAIHRAMQFSGRVLLAEDRKDNQKLFSIYLNKAGLEVDIVEDGEQAIEAALGGSYVLVLMDMQMPGKDGVTATEELRRYGYRIPIIALTANQSQEDRQRCKQAGFNDFLTKPISRADFVNLLSQYLRVLSPQESEMEEPIFSQLLQQEPDLLPAVDYFVGQLPDLQRRFEEVLELKDWQKLKELIHDLKGTAGGVGYPMLSKLAMEVEFAMAKQDQDEVTYLIGMVGNRIHRIQKGYTLQQQGAPTVPGKGH